MNTYNNQYIIQLLMINHPPHEHTPPACDTTKVVMLFCGNFAADGNWIFCQCLDDFKHHVSIMHVDNSKSGKLTLWFKSPKNSREKIYLRSICFVLKPWKKHGMQQYRLSHVATQQIVWLLLQNETDVLEVEHGIHKCLASAASHNWDMLLVPTQQLFSHQKQVKLEQSGRN